MKKETWALIIASVLTVMILNDFSLHLVELWKIEQLHPLYWFFWSFPSREAYSIFWTVHWGLALLLVVILLIFAFQVWERERSISRKRRPLTPRRP